MEITYIKLKRIREQKKLVAIADITIDNLIVIHGIKVLSNRDNELFIGMPNKKNPNGTYSDIVHPISVTARNVFENLLIPATERMMNEKRTHLYYKKTLENKTNNVEQSLDDFTIVEDDGIRFVNESVKDEILSWLNP